MGDSINPIELLVESKDLTSWGDLKKQEFTRIFTNRAKRYADIMYLTAQYVYNEALEKSFIPDVQWWEYIGRGCFCNHTNDFNEMEEIARARSRQILDELPALNKALEVIDPETSALVVQRDNLKSKIDELLKKLSSLSKTLTMSDYDDMLVKDFRSMVRGIEESREDLASKINKIAPDLYELERKVGNRLRKGVPEISTSLLSLVDGLRERSKNVPNMIRRVEERVNFGDSEAAMSIFSSFEKDELELSDSAKESLKKSLEALGVGASSKDSGKDKKKSRSKKLSK